MAEKKQYAMIVYSNYTEGMEKEYREWYASHHMHDLLNIKGFKGCRFYKLTQGQLNGTLEEKNYKYVMIWDWETDDLDALFNDIRAARTDGRMTWSPAFDRATFCTICEPITKYVSAEEIQDMGAEQVLKCSELLEWNE